MSSLHSSEESQVASQTPDADEEKSIDFMQIVLDSIKQSVSQLQSDFETKIKYDESKERTIDLLHRELQDHREDLNFKILRPVMLDIVSLYDDLNLICKKYTQPDGSSEVGKFTADVAAFASDIEEILSRHGFEFYQVDTDVFDRSMQTIQKAINTDQAQLDKCVIDRLRRGIRYGERIVRAELVTAYRYVEPTSHDG